MQQIRTEEAHAIQAGAPAVDVGILDSGIDGNHADFKDSDGTSNVDCARGADFTTGGPGVGVPGACVDNLCTLPDDCEGEDCAPGSRVPGFVSRIVSGEAPEADLPRPQPLQDYPPLNEAKPPTATPIRKPKERKIPNRPGATY